MNKGNKIRNNLGMTLTFIWTRSELWTTINAVHALVRALGLHFFTVGVGKAKT